MTAEHTAQPDLSHLLAPAGDVEQYLEAFFDSLSLPGNLAAAIDYGVLGAGKRLRPVLAVHACEAVGGTSDQAMPAAAAIELVHCFSLVHDDLPAMDDDDLRRGRPTLHKHAGEAMAILAGDAMAVLPFQLLASTVAPAKLATQLMLELSTATADIIAGQVYDTLPDFPDDLPMFERLETIHRLKTGALIRGACRMGAMAGGGGEQAVAAITRYADAVGLMFQIVDDLLDVTQTTEHLGKVAGKDADHGKLTYPGLLGVDESQRRVASLRQDAHAAIESLPDPARGANLRQLCDYMAQRSR